MEKVLCVRFVALLPPFQERQTQFFRSAKLQGLPGQKLDERGSIGSSFEIHIVGILTAHNVNFSRLFGHQLNFESSRPRTIDYRFGLFSFQD